MQEELKRIDAAYQRMFKKIGGKPHIKPRHKFKSVTFPGPSGWKITDNRYMVTLRKWDAGQWKRDPVPYTFFKHRDWHGTIKRVTFKRDACGDYWLCLTTDFVETELLRATGESVGVDFGMKDAFLTLSTGEKITIATIFETVLEQTAKPQQIAFAKSQRIGSLVALCPSTHTTL